MFCEYVFFARDSCNIHFILSVQSVEDVVNGLCT